MTPTAEIQCPRCHAALLSGSVCSSCGLQLEGKRLYDPGPFHWLGAVFSALVPIYMSSANWGMLGETRKRLLWLLLGFAGFTTLLFALGSMPRTTALSLLPLNLGISYYLRQHQKPLFEAGLRLGASRRPLWQGMVIGIGLLILALVIPTVGLLTSNNLRFERATRLVDEGHFSKAAVLFNEYLRQGPEDPAVVFDLALCRLAEGRWADSIEGFERSLALKGRDSAATYAGLAIARAGQGRTMEADSLAALARRIQPGVFTVIWNSGNVAMIADSIARNPAR